MRENLLPENFECRQQDMALAFIDELYERGPLIGALIAPAGCGKTHVLRRYQSECERRHSARLERRRVIAWDDAVRRFRAAGFRTADDATWFKNRWPSGENARISEVTLDERIHDRCEDRDPSPTGILNKPPLEDRPCPTPVVMTPSQSTTASAMIKLAARAVLKLTGSIWCCEDARHKLLAYLRRHPETLLIMDEAQRLDPRLLNVSREFYDDGGVSLLLVGTEDLEAKLMQRGAESLLSRVAIRERIEPLDSEQVHDLLTGWDERLIRRIYAHTGGYFRRILKLVNLCDQLREANDESKITEEILTEAALMIPDLLPDTSRMRGAVATRTASPGRGRPPGRAAVAETPPAARQAAG